MADVCHDRILKAINWTPTEINSLTANTPAAIRTPVHFASDREVLDRFWPTVGKFDPAEVTFAWIPNSLHLTTLAVSENLRGAIESNAAIEVLGEPQPFPFGVDGDLPQLEEFLENAPAIAGTGLR